MPGSRKQLPSSQVFQPYHSDTTDGYAYRSPRIQIRLQITLTPEQVTGQHESGILQMGDKPLSGGIIGISEYVSSGIQPKPLCKGYHIP